MMTSIDEKFKMASENVKKIKKNLAMKFFYSFTDFTNKLQLAILISHNLGHYK